LPAIVAAATVDPGGTMSHSEATELAFLRHQLRELLRSHNPSAAAEPLSRLRAVATGDSEIGAEYARWAFRFEMLAA
jgi:hypothetical protein